jgi:Zn-finger nucleic acid-binding protein
MRLEEAKEHFACDYCSTIHFPEPNADGIRVLGNPAETRCPACMIPLLHAAAGGVRILYCERCRGLLIPMESFLMITQTLRAEHEGPPAPPRPTDWKELERETLCPGCQQPMSTHPYAGPGNVVIDNCPACQLNWLDHAELRRIIAAP